MRSFLTLLLTALLHTAANAASPSPIETTLVDAEAIHLATSQGDARSPLFLLGVTVKAPVRLACLRSDDNDAAWHDHAVSEESFKHLHAIGGSREIAPDGFIRGSFTDVVNAASGEQSKGRAYFFRIAVRTDASQSTHKP